MDGDIKTQPKWVQVQQKTFTRWCNTFLLERDMKIIDLIIDLQDGILLFNLLEILSGEKIHPRYKKNAKFKLQKIENLNLSFMFLKQKEIKLINIGAEDLFDGKRKLILGLIWTLILRFQIQQVMDEDDGKSSVRKDLLDWCNRALNPQGVFVKNFEKDWQDGAAFAGLVNYCRGNPEFDLAKMPRDARPDRIKNLEGAFDKAEEYFGFPQLLEAEDTCDCPDELSVMTYVSYFRGYKTENEACASKCIAYGPGLTDATTYEQAEYTVELRNDEGERIKLGGAHVTGELLLGDHKEKAICKDNGNGLFSCRYTVKVAGTWELSVKVDGAHIKDSPFHPVAVPGKPDPSQCTADPASPVTAGDEQRFTVTTRDGQGKLMPKGGADVASVLKCDGGKDVPVAIADNDDGTYGATYTPTVAGTHRLHVDVDAATIKDAPFAITVLAAAPDAASSYAEGDGLARASPDDDATFRVITVDRFGNRCDKGGFKLTSALVGESQQGTVPVDVKDNDDGTYSCSYRPKKTGAYRLDVALGGANVRDAPFKVQVDAGKGVAGNTTAEGDGLKIVVAGEQGDFKVTVRDAAHNVCGAGGDKVAAAFSAGPDSALKVGVTDNGDGTYDGAYVPTVIGDYTLDVTLDNDAIADSPFAVRVVPAAADPSQTTAEGEGTHTANTDAPAEFTVITRDKFGNQCTDGGAPVNVSLSGPGDVKPSVKDNGDGTYAVQYHAPVAGDYQLDVKLGNDDIKDAPFKVHVAPGKASAKNTTASGPGLTAAVAGVPNHFDVQTRDENNNPCAGGGAPIEAKIVAADGSGEHPARVTDNGDGTYRVDYDGIEKVGDYKVHVTLDGDECKDCPHTLVVSPNADDVSAANSFATGDGLKLVVAGETGKFRVQIVDSFGNEVRTGGTQVAAYAAGPRAYKCAVTDNGDGTYDGAYVPEKTGAYQVHIAVRSEALGASPYDVKVVPAAAHGPSSYAEGRGLTRATVATPGKEGEFVVHTRDRFLNPCVEGGAPLAVALSGPESIKGEVKDKGDGSYYCCYDIELAGDYKMDVTVGGEHVQDSPFTVVARPGGTHVANTEVVKSAKAAPGGAETFKLQLKDVKGNARHKGGDNVKVVFESVVKHEADAIDNGDGTFSVAMPAHMRGNVAIKTRIGDEEVPAAAALQVQAEEAPLSAAEADAVKAKMPGSANTLLRLLANCSPEERADILGELSSGLKSDAELRQVREQEEAARSAKAEAKAKEEADRKAAKKAAKAEQLSAAEAKRKAEADRDAAEAAAAKEAADKLRAEVFQ